MTTMGRVFSTEQPVRFSHCDPAGIVYFPQVFDLINALKEDWFMRGIKVSYADLIMNRRVGTPTIDIQCEFIKPCRYGEIIELQLWVTRIGRSSFDLRERGVVEGEIRWRSRHVLCFISLDSYRAVPIPERVREGMQQFLIEEETVPVA